MVSHTDTLLDYVEQNQPDSNGRRGITSNGQPLSRFLRCSDQLFLASEREHKGLGGVLCGTENEPISGVFDATNRVRSAAH